jgi:hypothetical protein
MQVNAGDSGVDHFNTITTCSINIDPGPARLVFGGGEGVRHLILIHAAASTATTMVQQIEPVEEEAGEDGSVEEALPAMRRGIARFRIVAIAVKAMQ